MKRIWILSLLSLAILLAVGLFLYRKQSYEIVHPKRSSITEAIYGLGRVKSNRRFEVIVGVISTVSRLYVDEGSEVKRGDPLIAFDSQALFRAPFRGTVTLVKARERETAVPNTPVLRLEDLTDRFLELSLEQQAALRVRPGNVAKISFESVRGKVLNGKVSALFSRENEFIAQVQVEGLDQSVLPGMTADVTVEVGEIADGLLIPASAVQNGMVSVKRDGKWQKVKVEIGLVDGAFAEVKGDTLSPQDEIRLRKD